MQRKFYHLEHFLENEKLGNHSMKRLVNIMNKVERTSQNPTFPNVILSECGFAFSRSTQFPYLKSEEHFHAHIVAVENIRLY